MKEITIIEQLLGHTAEAFAPTNPAVAADIVLGTVLLDFITKLFHHSKAKLAAAQTQA